MNHRAYPLLAVLCSTLIISAEAQVPISARLSGTWIGRGQDRADGGELILSQGDKLVISFEGLRLAGRYEIDSSKSPNLLVFYPDFAPKQKLYSSLRITSDKEIRLSSLCDGTPEALSKQDFISFLRK